MRHTRLMTRTVLAFHAHPDDESSKGAGTISRYSASGVRCVLVTATGGEAGDVLNPAMDRPEIRANLKEVREAELAEAAAILGYDEVILMGYRDSGMPNTDANADPRAFCNQPFDEVLARLIAIVREVRPDVFLGYDDHEFYPHPDHLRVHELSLRVYEAAADPNQFPEAGDPWEIKKMYAPTIFTRDRVTAIHEAMLARGESSPFGDWIERFANQPVVERDTTRIDVTGYIDQSWAALQAHRTQVDPAGFWFVVPIEVIEEVYPWEEFEVLASRVGWSAGEDDFFAGIA